MMRITCPTCRSEDVSCSSIDNTIVVCECDACHAPFTIRLPPHTPSEPVRPSVPRIPID
jgi:transcription elongation factor Elf1